MQTPHRFRSRRQLWTYGGLGIETHDSAQYGYVNVQLQRSKKPQQIRGLNRNHNHEMKEIFKGAATRASCGVGQLRDFYVALQDKGMKPEFRCLAARFQDSVYTPEDETILEVISAGVQEISLQVPDGRFVLLRTECWGGECSNWGQFIQNGRRRVSEPPKGPASEGVLRRLL